MTKKEVVRLEDVWAHYDSVPVLEGINLSIYQDDFLGIIGPNGGGKTTLLKVILGLVKPGRGTVSVFGNTPEKGRKRIGYVSQHSLFDRNFPASVWDVVMMGRLGKRGPFRKYSKQDRDAALHALETMEILDHRDQQIGKLSGGQRQRVFVARALVTEPELLLLDEPTASIDTPLKTGFYELLERLKQRMAIVLVSHDISTISIHVDKIACLNRELYYHSSKELSAEGLEAAYRCPVEMIAHGVPHRILKEHQA
ncbi:MAG: metal ABC transporter ATP-binding protein [Dehalococcoidia bacterium]|nr:High-affinity zinc uptake system ATP-binding protein ZnuC [Chloroflexota bacterium]MBT9160661.1 High-affinity zinc uptake system ATP-binding protein ZnuC [Chloroflexota bacterium]MBT9162543.1 High-affinity zinc uptake system ATP-binding protein ZnuC [Chloroflexota bacterium]